jgi:hypothetical protein
VVDYKFENEICENTQKIDNLNFKKLKSGASNVNVQISTRQHEIIEFQLFHESEIVIDAICNPHSI